MGREKKNEWREGERERISGISSKEANEESRIGWCRIEAIAASSMFGNTMRIKLSLTESSGKYRGISEATRLCVYTFVKAMFIITRMPDRRSKLIA